MTGTTVDDFLGGKIRIRQPQKGYRAGMDPVLLAASIPARSGDSVLDLGTGAGVALFCLMARVGGLDGAGLERDPEMAALARDNARSNGFEATVWEGDVAAPPKDMRKRSFDHVFANPPFFDRSQGSRAQDRQREGGRGGETPLASWIDTGMRRLRPGGSLTLVQRIEMLPPLLSCLGAGVGAITVLPIAARAGRPAKLVIVQCVKGARGAFCLLPAFVMHDGERHLADGDDHSSYATAVLRHGEALELRGFTNS